MHPNATGIPTTIASVTDVGQTGCCWMVSAGILNMGKYNKVQPTCTGQGQLI